MKFDRGWSTLACVALTALISGCASCGGGAQQCGAWLDRPWDCVSEILGDGPPRGPAAAATPVAASPQSVAAQTSAPRASAPAANCETAACAPEAERSAWLARGPAGPPPARYRPELPAKFLPVPTSPTLATTSCDAPQHLLGDVDVDFGRRLNFAAPN